MDSALENTQTSSFGGVADEACMTQLTEAANKTIVALEWRRPIG